jgi:hypothetical protein
MPKHMLMLGAVLMTAGVAWVGWGTPPALAQPAHVPQTGQTTCWDAAGSPINCDGTGQDGDIQAGVVSPTPRFRDNRNGTVRDNLTGLIWLKNANCFGPQLWANALQAANTLASPSCGLSDRSMAGDWRLPNVKELQSLIDFGNFVPALPSGHPFSGALGSFWSSTTLEEHPDFAEFAWFVSVSSGETRVSRKTDISVWSNVVWPVRGPE